MGDKITSHNQSGGITAKTVSGTSFTTTHHAATVAPDHRRKWVRWILGAIGFIASIVGILQYFGYAPWE